jgi:hypothetical protein
MGPGLNAILAVLIVGPQPLFGVDTKGQSLSSAYTSDKGRYSTISLFMILSVGS